MSSYIDLNRVAENSLAARPNSSLYFLLDHGGLPGLHRELLKSCVTWESLFDDTTETSALAAAPLLVLVCTENRLIAPPTLMEWIAKNGTFSSSITIFASPLEIDEIRIRLSSRLAVRLSDDMEAMLRFFDPRVLEALVKIMPEAQKNEFLGFAEYLAYVDRGGNLIDIFINFNAREDFPTPFVIGRQQESALLEASEIDQVLDLLRSIFPAHLTSIKESEQYFFVSRQVEFARRLGFDSVLQFSIYAAQMLLEGEGFVESPLYPAFLDEVRQNGR